MQYRYGSTLTQLVASKGVSSTEAGCGRVHEIVSAQDGEVFLLPLIEGTRRLFLRRFRCQCETADGSVPSALVFNVEIMIPLQLSSSSRDTLDDVVDYDIMRQAAVQSSSSDVEERVSAAVEYLLEHPKIVSVGVSASRGDSGSVVASRMQTKCAWLLHQ
ncbi:hypothetical protein [Ralstonia syzygii]|nr:hypothetical protein [Ralstonia syzygii]